MKNITNRAVLSPFTDTSNLPQFFLFFFFFNDTATTEIYTLSLHDALPISVLRRFPVRRFVYGGTPRTAESYRALLHQIDRSEEHTSELQSQSNLVCRLLLEKKKSNLQQSHTCTRRRARPIIPQPTRNTLGT